MSRWSSSHTDSTESLSESVDTSDVTESMHATRPRREELIIELGILTGCAIPALLYVLVAAATIRDGNASFLLWLPAGLSLLVAAFAAVSIARGSISSRESTLLSLVVIWFGTSVGVGILALFEVGVIPALEPLIETHESFDATLFASLRTSLYVTGTAIIGSAAVLSYGVLSARD